MNTTFEKYLDTIDKCLKPLPTSERVDIVKEIKETKNSLLKSSKKTYVTDHPEILFVIILSIIFGFVNRQNDKKITKFL